MVIELNMCKSCCIFSRLPVTPAQMRDARPGEVYMSLGGSPIRDTYAQMQVVKSDS